MLTLDQQRKILRTRDKHEFSCPDGTYQPKSWLDDLAFVDSIDEVDFVFMYRYGNE